MTQDSRKYSSFRVTGVVTTFCFKRVVFAKSERHTRVKCINSGDQAVVVSIRKGAGGRGMDGVGMGGEVRVVTPHSSAPPCRGCECRQAGRSTALGSYAADSRSLHATAVMRAAPFPLPSSDNRNVTSQSGASSRTVSCMIFEK